MASEADAPTQDAPTQDAPTQDAPTQDAPTQDAPTQDAPTQDAPTQDAPTQDAPTQDAPTAKVHTYTLAFKQRKTGQRSDWRVFNVSGNDDSKGVFHVQDGRINAVPTLLTCMNVFGRKNEVGETTFAPAGKRSGVYCNTRRLAGIVPGQTIMASIDAATQTLTIATTFPLFVGATAVEGGTAKRISGPVASVETIEIIEAEHTAMVARYNTRLAALLATGTK
jgi:hypothetical protein